MSRDQATTMASCSASPWGALFEGGPVAGLSDGELLDRFRGESGPASTAAVCALVERHSALVWRTCRAALGNDADASDAFQATFLTLVRRAGTIRRGDSVAPWLGGVARRVAARARVEAARRAQREAIAARRAGLAVEHSPADSLGERAAIVRAELVRLSDRDRAVVLACDLDGLSETEAARRLGCPVGTVRSRLHRARGRLRARLVARGLDPAGSLGLTFSLAASAVPPGLIARTAAVVATPAARLVPGVALSPAVFALMRGSRRRIAMLPVLTLGSVGTALVGLASAFFAPGEATSRPAPQDPAPATKPAEPPAIVPAPALNLEDTEGARDARPKLSPEAQAEQFRAIRAEYDALWDNANEKAKAGKNEAEQGQIRASLRPDEVKFARRMMDLAIVDPKSKVARDAAIWVMDKTWMSDVGYNGSEFEAAVGLLVHNHADDPEAVRVGLQLNSAPSRRREEFVEGCYANATSREAKGLARLAYAQYLEKMVPSVRAAIKHPERNVIHFTRHDENGKLVPTSIPEPNGEFAYKVGLRRLDPDALRAEAERLYQEVIAEYGDIPYITRGTRRLEAELVRPLPADATAKDRLERAGIEQMLQRKSTLADAARARLRGMNELRVGVPAPGFDKVDVRTGRPIRLADLRGTVVYLFPWSDRGDEMRDIVERVKAAERRERERGRPFAAIGLVGGETKEAARAMIERNGVEWLNIFEPDRVESGSVARAYQVRGYTDTYLIDREGRIARRQVVGRNLAEALDRLAEPPKAP